VLAELSGLVALQAEALGPFQEALVQLDFGLARARYGLELGAVRPELSADPAPPGCCTGCATPFCSGSSAMPAARRWCR